MEPLVETVIEDGRWEELDLPALATRAAEATLAALDIPAEGFTLVVMGCDDARIAELNGAFRQKGKATNVLSWPSEERASEEPGVAPEPPEPGDPEDPEPLGDVAIAFETCQREAAEQGKPVTDHVTHLLVHGVLHLLGYDHVEEADGDLMEATETRILAGLGVPDPY
ncbi:rRNA maturation RNase YbeY [Cereibacter sphaeroides]|uniref:rRNA maturation RNase YbeY n=1 Tax=Cereibacter sphaeroides TaxID=1063 RepID=UPI000F532597|nr:rRNA maturation RNase YbeY [Cereibacter sphaeroides]AZB65551.1 rRNA maturation RNase YbeY [Cereibacter sphaeroides]AZB70305.1 rRNA maturation RNase YbeY [Cereibacter sphaeroides]